MGKAETTPLPAGEPSTLAGADVHGTVPGQPGVIPTSQVVILKEEELDCDLSTAIQRVRDAAETAHSRILVVGPDDPGEATETAVAPTSRPIVCAPTTLGQVARRAEERAVEKLGARMDGLALCLNRFLEEAVTALGDMQREVASGSTTPSVRVLGEVLQWTEAVVTDLQVEADRARGGFQPVSTLELVQEMARQVETHAPQVRVNVASTGPIGSCWSRPADLAEALFLGMMLVAHRIGCRGGVGVEVAVEGDHIVHRIQGSGEPTEIEATEAVARFRKLVHAHAGIVSHDGLGPHGTGLTLELPRIV